MPNLQQKVTSMSKALVGTFVNGDIRKVYRATATANTTLALGVFSNKFGLVSNVKGVNDIFCGIALNTYTSYGQNFFGGGMIVPSGGTMDVATEGDIYITLPTGTAKFGGYIFSSNINGMFTTASVATPQNDKTLTSYRVIEVIENDGTDDIVYISNVILKV